MAMKAADMMKKKGGKKAGKADSLISWIGKRRGSKKMAPAKKGDQDGEDEE